ncbi:RNA polymerase sigma factor [Paenibacillus caui]|uniref:RNA polymerase sigma factor n=1 Tax=Paenibacillus caui TaxID=2873927 RepID=UPI001CA7F24D|nr:RNA polymerase sigma factor [Paenibacillus caui]
MITDEELVKRMVQGEQEAFEMLVTRYHGPLLSYSAQQLNDREKAKDIVQEVFIRLIRHLRLHGELEHVRPWLYKVVLNLCRDYWRSAAFRSETVAHGEMPEHADLDHDVPGILERREMAAEVAACLDSLPEQQGNIIRLRFLQDLKLQEIAELLDIPLSSVKSNLYSGLRKLRRIMERPGKSQSPKKRGELA